MPFLFIKHSVTKHIPLPPPPPETITISKTTNYCNLLYVQYKKKMIFIYFSIHHHTHIYKKNLGKWLMHLMGTPEKILLFRISRSYRVINLHNNFFPPSILYFFWFLGSEMCLALLILHNTYSFSTTVCNFSNRSLAIERWRQDIRWVDKQQQQQQKKSEEVS